MKKIRVLVADDQVILAEGLSMLLNTEEDIEAIGCVSNGVEVLNYLKNHTIDVVLMDIRMPVMNGVECTRVISEKYPEVKVLILTTFDDEQYIKEALNNGAAGYMLKDLTAENLSSAVRNVHQGNTVMHKKITAKLVGSIGQKSNNETVIPILDCSGQSLLPRELEVLQYLAMGYRNNEIAEQLFLSEGTVKNYISLLYDKLGIKGRTKLMKYAIDHGVLDQCDK